MPSSILPAITDSRWIRSLVQGMGEAISAAFPTGEPLDVEAYKRIAAGYEIVDYGSKLVRHRSVLQKVDLMVFERTREDRWSPRVGIECLMGESTTRTAQALEGRASQLKRVNPAMRFGAFVGGIASGELPTRLVKSCPTLDFVACWEGQTPRPDQWTRISALMSAEVTASRALETLLLQRTDRAVGPLRFVHRGLTIE